MHLPRFLPAAAAVLLLTASSLAGDLEDGIKLRSDGKFEQALVKLQKAVDADPKNAVAAAELSRVLTGLGKYEQAAKCVGPALEANPNDVSLLVARSRAWIGFGDAMARDGGDPNMILAYVGDADVWAKKALDKDPKNSEARYIKARILQHQNGSDQTEAKAAFEALVKDDPKCFDAHWELAQMSLRKARAKTRTVNDWAAAEKHFRDAFAADPKSGQAILQATYAKAWQRVALAPELINDYTQCAAILPDDPAPYASIWKLRKQAAPEARAALEKLAKAPATAGKAKAYLCLIDGDAALAAGKPKEATEAYSKAPEHFGATGDGKDIYVALHDAGLRGAGFDADQREQMWTAAWKAWPDRPAIPSNVGLWYRDVGHDFKRAETWYLRAAAAAPTSPQVLNDTGVIYHYHLNQFDKAEAWYRKAVAAAREQGVEPSDDARNDIEGVGFRDALNNLAKVLAAQKHWKELRQFAEDDVPEGFPGRDQWLNAGKDDK